LVEEFIEGDKAGVNGRDRRVARAKPAAAARR
jgi:hypothetical protein